MVYISDDDSEYLRYTLVVKAQEEGGDEGMSDQLLLDMAHQVNGFSSDKGLLSLGKEYIKMVYGRSKRFIGGVKGL